MKELSIEEMAVMQGGNRRRSPFVTIGDINISVIIATQTAVAIGKYASASNSIEVTQHT